ncbi:hypothetical protein LXL04_008939 [Taraxacum kok-saghyz]
MEIGLLKDYGRQHGKPTSKADGKTYRFLDQLEALESNTTKPPAGMSTTATTQHPFSQPSVVIPFNITGSHQAKSVPSPFRLPIQLLPLLPPTRSHRNSRGRGRGSGRISLGG